MRIAYCLLQEPQTLSEGIQTGERCTNQRINWGQTKIRRMEKRKGYSNEIDCRTRGWRMECYGQGKKK